MDEESTSSEFWLHIFKTLACGGMSHFRFVCLFSKVLLAMLYITGILLFRVLTLKCILLINQIFNTVSCCHKSCQINLRGSTQRSIVPREQVSHPASEQHIKSASEHILPIINILNHHHADPKTTS